MSLATATDALLFRSIGQVNERDAHLVFSCPDLPSYRWGNRIHFMSKSDVAGYEKLMAEDLSTAGHYAFSFDVASYEDFPAELWSRARVPARLKRHPRTERAFSQAAERVECATAPLRC